MSKHASKRNVAAKQAAAIPPARKPAPAIPKQARPRKPSRDQLVFSPATPAAISEELLWESLARLEAQAEALQREITTLRRLVAIAKLG